MSEANTFVPGAKPNIAGPVEFQTSPETYRHWRLNIDPPVATLSMDVDEQGGLVPGYELKLNSYDLGVDIELYDAVQRLRFEHPEVGDKEFIVGGNFELEIAGTRYPATASLKPMYDPSSKKLRC